MDMKTLHEHGRCSLIFLGEGRLSVSLLMWEERTESHASLPLW
jgi:hypothetical protein